jgi:6-phosphogluconolactonase
MTSNLAGESLPSSASEARQSRRVEVLPELSDLVYVATEMVRAASLISIARRGVFRIALAGGSTPRPIYERLAADPDIDWRKWHLFWGDERTVPPTDPESNYNMVRSALLDRISQPPGLVVRIPSDLPPDEAALRYEQSVRDLVPYGQAAASSLPRFDMILLGIGDDGHTASLFPGTPAIHETERLVVANPVAAHSTTRITFTYPLINAARRILVLVSGEQKARAVREALTGPYEPEQIPIQAVNPVDGQLTWLVDEAAFSNVDSEIDSE